MCTDKHTVLVSAPGVAYIDLTMREAGRLKVKASPCKSLPLRLVYGQSEGKAHRRLTHCPFRREREKRFVFNTRAQLA